VKLEVWRDAQRFVLKHSYGLMTVPVVLMSTSSMNGLWANAYYQRRRGEICAKAIQVDNEVFPALGAVYRKAVLLHELGHYMGGTPYKRGHSERECGSHLWAMRTAHGLGMSRVHRRLVKMLEDWELMTWNEEGGSNRRYIKAAKLVRAAIKRSPRGAYGTR